MNRVLAASVLLLAAGCASVPEEPPLDSAHAVPGEPAAPVAAAPEPEPAPAPAPFLPSGLKEDFKLFSGTKAAWKAARTEDARTEARAKLDALVAELVARWSARVVPAPEGQYWGTILREAGRHGEAVAAYRGYLAVSDPASANSLASTTNMIASLVDAGEFDGAAAELERAAATVYADRPEDRARAETALALGLMRAGRLEEAAARFGMIMDMGPGDPESALHGVDCLLRLGRTDAAARLAAAAAARFPEGRVADRMRLLVDQVALVGRPSPGFGAARWWKGEGPPPTEEELRGKVVVVYSWNMQAQWVRWFFERLNRLHADYAPRGVVVVGISRLHRFDPNKMVYDESMTEEQELMFYDAWKKEYAVAHPLAVGEYDGALMEAWSARVIPMIVVVGKDGAVAYVRTGKDEEHFGILREVLERELAR